MGNKVYKHNDYYGYINKIQEQAISDPYWFWSDDSKASEARQWLYDNDAEEIVDNIYDNTPEDLQKTISHKKLSQRSDLKRTTTKIKDGRNNFAQHAFNVGSIASAVPSLGVSLIAAPVTTVLGVATGIGGSLLGDRIGMKFNNNYINSEGIPVASTDAKMGSLIGGTMGGLVGGFGGAKIDKKINKPQWLDDFIDDLSWNRNKADEYRRERLEDYDTDVAYRRYVEDGVFDESFGDKYGRDYLQENNSEFNLSKDEVRDFLWKISASGQKFKSDGTFEVIPNPYRKIADKLGLPSFDTLNPITITDDIAQQVNSILTKGYRKNSKPFQEINGTTRITEKLSPGFSRKGRMEVVRQAREAEKGLSFVLKGITAKTPNYTDQWIGFRKNPDYYRPPKFTMRIKDIDTSLNDSETNTAIIGVMPKRRFFRKLFRHGLIYNTGETAAHEAGHSKSLFNTKGTKQHLIPDFNNLTDNEKRTIMSELYKDSPNYQIDYSSVPKRQKELLRTTKKVNDHDFELNEGYSDAWGTRYNMQNINDAALHPDKKYTYWDLIRYKLTPQGIGDRFIQQRGGWWKGWKQQLDALNEVYKQGGKL